MKKKRMTLIAGLLFGSMMLAACGQDDQGGAVVDDLKPIEVELNVPEAADANEAITFSSTVTQGDDLVEDATEVVYEIWLEGEKEQSEMIEADKQEGNTYLLTHTFENDGLFHVQTHVTARGLHRMPTAQIQVGEIEEGGQEAHEGEHSEGEHHHGNVEIHAVVENDRVVIHVEVEGEAFVGGEVTLEMSQEDAENPQWLDTTEVGNGEYELSNIEELTGTYKAIIHITDDTVHEHVEEELVFE